jgi:hypothetical protein
MENQIGDMEALRIALNIAWEKRIMLNGANFMG